MEELLDEEDYQGAQSFVARSKSVEHVVVRAGLASFARGAEACGAAMLSAKANARIRLEERLGILGTVGANPSFIGLLGTVLGIIEATHDLSL